jgi:hypothetical protein
MCEDLTIDSGSVMACIKAVGCNGGSGASSADQGSCSTIDTVPTIWIQPCVGSFMPSRVTCGACVLAKSKNNMCNMLSSAQAFDRTNASLVSLDASAGLAGLYGKYELQQPPSLMVTTESNSNVCRSVSVSDMNTKWQGPSGAIDVTHKGGRFIYEMSDTTSSITGFKRTPEGLCRRALGALKVTEFKASTSSSSWTLVAAHRINYRYGSTWSDNWLDSKELARLEERGIATSALYDSVGLVWFLLMRNGTNFAMCTGYLPAYFADRVYGNLPVSYNICTATRHQATCEDKRSWLFDDDGFSCTEKQPREEFIADKIKPAKWIADKFAEPIVPFFKDTSGAVTDVVAAALKSSIGAPLGAFIDDMRYAYFGIVGTSALGQGPLGSAVSGPVVPGPLGPLGPAVPGPTALTALTAPDVTTAPTGSGTNVTKGPTAPSAPTGAAKGLDPVAIAVIVGVCIGAVVIALLVVMYMRRSRRNAMYDWFGYDYYGYPKRRRLWK